MISEKAVENVSTEVKRKHSLGNWSYDVILESGTTSYILYYATLHLIYKKTNTATCDVITTNLTYGGVIRDG